MSEQPLFISYDPEAEYRKWVGEKKYFVTGFTLGEGVERLILDGVRTKKVHWRPIAA
jgi:hypothetical protein